MEILKEAFREDLLDSLEKVVGKEAATKVVNNMLYKALKTAVIMRLNDITTAIMQDNYDAVRDLLEVHSGIAYISFSDISDDMQDIGDIISTLDILDNSI